MSTVSGRCSTASRKGQGADVKDEQVLRAEISAAGRDLAREGLVVGTAGNISARGDGYFLVTPSGMLYPSIGPADIVRLEEDGTPLPGNRKPSSERPMHLALYRTRADIQAVVHTHSVYATMLACSGRDIPPVHYAVGSLGGRVPLGPYATYGTDELAESVVDTLGPTGGAVLMENHGVTAVGRSVEEALERARLVEWLARLYVGTLALGHPQVLCQEEMADVMQRLAHYGQEDA